MPKKTRGRDGVYERDGRPGYWISYVDEFGKRRQQYGGPTVTQAREKREEIRTRAREVKALANGKPLPTEDTFGVVAKRTSNTRESAARLARSANRRCGARRASSRSI